MSGRAPRRPILLAGLTVLAAWSAPGAGSACAQTVPWPGGLAPRETAAVGARGEYSVGVFNPLSLGLGRRMELRAHPVLLFVAPHAVLRIEHRDGGGAGWTLTGEYGLSLPTPALRLTKGTLFPTCDDGEDCRIGWSVVPRAGLVASRGAGAGGVFTLAADLAAGLPLSRNDARPTDTLAPLELLLAPALRGFRGHLGALVDFSVRRLGPRWRIRGYGDLYLQGGERDAAYSPGSLGWTVDRTSLVTRLGAGVDVGIGGARGGRIGKRLTLGAAWWSYDQHRIDPMSFSRRRSHDVFPTMDFIWSR